MAGEMMGATPVYDVCGNNGNFGGGTWTWVFLLFILLAWGGNGFGFGGRNDAYQAGLTRAELCDGFNFNQIENGIRGAQNGLCDGFYAQNTTMLQGFNGIQRDMCQGFSTLNSGITNLGYQMQNCCCDTNRNIDAVRYEAAKNTCDITTAIHAEGEATRALINANTMQDLRDRLEARDRELMTANFQLSQQAQTANLVDELRPCSRPAYITCSPYESANNRFFGYGRDCGGISKEEWMKVYKYVNFALDLRLDDEKIIFKK